MFRTTSETSGVILWTGKHYVGEHSRSGYLGLFIVDEFLELRVELGSAKSIAPVIIRSKVSFRDNCPTIAVMVQIATF